MPSTVISCRSNISTLEPGKNSSPKKRNPPSFQISLSSTTMARTSAVPERGSNLTLIILTAPSSTQSIPIAQLISLGEISNTSLLLPTARTTMEISKRCLTWTITMPQRPLPSALTLTTISMFLDTLSTTCPSTMPILSPLPRPQLNRILLYYKMIRNDIMI